MGWESSRAHRGVDVQDCTPFQNAQFLPRVRECTGGPQLSLASSRQCPAWDLVLLPLLGQKKLALENDAKPKASRTRFGGKTDLLIRD